MTIAACYVSPEGVVLGADSTTTYGNGGNPHYFNHAQKLFEVGEDSTWGIVTWGLGGLVVNSHRTVVAKLADDLSGSTPVDAADVANRWVDLFWPLYSNSQPLAPHIQRCQALHEKQSFGSLVVGARDQSEEEEYINLRNSFSAGFCIAGYIEDQREPAAYEIFFDPVMGKPTPTKIDNGFKFWGAPNMIQRLIFGFDDGVAATVVGSQHWNGTMQDFLTTVQNHQLAHAFTIPIREAIDFVHACIYSTIKAFKFSNLSQICGGPIEIAVITTDRKFRWVRHKAWDAAIVEGDPW